LKAEPRNVTARYYLGLSILQQEKYRDALDIFLKVKDEQDKAEQRTRSAIPSEYQMQLAIARARLGLKQYAEAWKNLESAKIEDANSSDVYMYRGLYYLQQEKHAEAIKELEKAISLNKNNAYAYYYAGLAYAGSGNGEKAVETLKLFLQLAPNAPEAAKAKSLIDSLC
jgi:tetratricopeptide (TPR) repeat protein